MHELDKQHDEGGNGPVCACVRGGCVEVSAFMCFGVVCMCVCVSVLVGISMVLSMDACLSPGNVM